MAVNKHPSGGFRAYKKINGITHQRYSFDQRFAQKMQDELDAKSRAVNALKGRSIFHADGRLIGLRVRDYKKTNRATFQLQVLVDGKQKKTERFFKSSFEVTWKIFFTLWREHYSLSMTDIISYKEKITKAKRLYMQDVYNLDQKIIE
jgi:hypothetical protein